MIIKTQEGYVDLDKARDFYLMPSSMCHGDSVSEAEVHLKVTWDDGTKSKYAIADNDGPFVTPDFDNGDDAFDWADMIVREIEDQIQNGRWMVDSVEILRESIKKHKDKKACHD